MSSGMLQHAMGQARVPAPLHQPCPHATTSFRTHKSASAGLLAAMAAVALGPFRGSGVIAGGRVRQLMTAAEAAAEAAVSSDFQNALKNLLSEILTI